MQISKEGLELIKKYEGCKLKAYRDPIGIPTIGYGHTKNVTMGQVITEKQAEEYLKQDVFSAECKVRALNARYHWTQAEFDSLTSFCFNIGSLTGLTKFSTRTKDQIAEKMLLYVNAGGHKMQGLVKRRKEEHDLFVSEVPEPNILSNYEIGTKHKIIVSGLRLRAGATIDAPEIRKLKKSASYVVKNATSDTEGNIWLQIAEGYACAIYKGKKYID